MIADPWTARNRTEEGRKQAEGERQIKELIKKGKLKTWFGPPPGTPINRDTSYPQPKPFWEG
jgi:hypothetical protein